MGVGDLKNRYLFVVNSGETVPEHDGNADSFNQSDEVGVNVNLATVDEGYDADTESDEPDEPDATLMGQKYCGIP